MIFNNNVISISILITQGDGLIRFRHRKRHRILSSLRSPSHHIPKDYINNTDFNMTAFWDMSLRSCVAWYKSVGWKCCLHLKGW